MSFEQNDFEKRLLKNKLLNSQTNPNEQTDAQTYTIPPLWLLDWAFSRSARQKSEFSCWTIKQVAGPVKKQGPVHFVLELC